MLISFHYIFNKSCTHGSDTKCDTGMWVIANDTGYSIIS